MNKALLGVGTLFVLLLSGMNSFLSAQEASEDLELIRVVKTNNHSLHVSPDGTKYVERDANGAVIRDVESGREICSAEAKTGRITLAYFFSVVFSPDGKRIAVVNSESCTITICDAETGRKTTEWSVAPRKRRRLRPEEGFSIPIIQFAPDGKTLLVGVRNEEMMCVDMIHLFHADSGKLVREWDVLELDPDGAALIGKFLFSPDGRYFTFLGSTLTQGKSGPSFVFDTEDGSVFHKFEGRMSPVWFTSDSKTLICNKLEGNNPDCLIVFDMETKKEKKHLPYLSQPVAETPDGKHLFFITHSGWASQDLVGIDLETGETVYGPKKLPFHAVSLHGRTLLVSRTGHRRIDGKSGVEHGFEFYELAPLDTLIAKSRNREEGVSAAPMETAADTVPQWKASRAITMDEQVADESAMAETIHVSLALSPNGKLLVTSCHRNDFSKDKDCYIVWDTASGKEIKRIHRGGRDSFACFLPNEKELLLLQSPASEDSSSRQFSIFDTETWKIKRSFIYDGILPSSMQHTIFFNDGTCLCYQYEKDGMIARRAWKVIDLTTGKNVFTSDESVSNAFVSKDGRTIGGGSYSNVAKVWKLDFYDIATGKKIREFENMPITEARFFPDGKKIQANYRDSQGSKHVVLDAESGEVLGAFGEQREMQSSRVSPDGRYCYVINVADKIPIFDSNTCKQIGELVVSKNKSSLIASITPQIVLSQDGKTLAAKPVWGDQVMIFTRE